MVLLKRHLPSPPDVEPMAIAIHNGERDRLFVYLGVGQVAARFQAVSDRSATRYAFAR